MAAAASAAIGLHLLAFQLWPQFSPITLSVDEGRTLLVELVKHAPSATPEPSPQPQKRISRSKPESKKPEATTLLTSSEPDHAPAKAAEAADKMQQQTSKTAIEHPAQPGAMPAKVQQMILTRITYPRQARRKGWQGRATFDLDIRAQRLAKLDLYHSSGYDLLDRAAMRGIRAVEQLPLSDGLYRLPVEFRLQ